MSKGGKHAIDCGCKTGVNIGSIAEVAELAGVSKQVVSNWRKRYDDFPEPIVKLAMGPIFNMDQIEAWHQVYLEERK